MTPSYLASNRDKSIEDPIPPISNVSGHEKSYTSFPSMNTNANSPKSSVNSVVTTSVSVWDISFNDLTLETEIGSGQYGVVFKGRWRDAVCAIKKLINDLSPEQLAEFRGEAELMSKLRPHPNVVQFLGVCSKPGKPLCIVAEFLEGGSLSSLIYNKPNALSADQQVDIARGCAAGLLHLSSEGIIHRDLAARNILLTGNLTPKVSDFGMSRFGMTEENVHKTTSNFGPLRWMSPESLLEREYSEKSDVWSYGVLLYELTTSKLPYENLDMVQVATKVSNGKLKLEPSPSSPPVLQKLILKCQQLSPASRPTFKEIGFLFSSI